MTHLRAKLIRLAATMPQGSPNRKALLEVLSVSSRNAGSSAFDEIFRRDTTLRGDLGKALRASQDALALMRDALRKIERLIPEIENDMEGAREGNTSDDPYALDDDPYFQSLITANQAAQDIRMLLRQETKGSGESRILSLIDDLRDTGGV